MSNKISRRSILAGAGAVVGSTVVSLPGMASFVRPVEKRAKNIIYCVSDGMSAGVPSMADQFKDVNFGERGVWCDLMRRPEVVQGVMDTRSLNSLMTDSAAAATSWGSGSLVLNGAINYLPGIGELTPLYDLLGKAGMRRGLVTTATITHATPSGFAVSSAKRSAEPEIARQYLARGVEVLMGGGDEFFSAELRADKIDVYGEFAAKGYGVAKNRDEMWANDSRRFLGIYGKGQLPFSVDRMHNEDIEMAVPSLAEMTKSAIDRLKGGSEGFVLQVEGARIDHAAHPNDLAGLIYDQLAFEAAVDVAMRFAEEDGDTLVVVTSDHGNANPGISNGPAGYGDANGLSRLMKMTSSYERMLPELRAADAAGVQGLAEAKLGVEISANQAAMVVSGLKGGDDSPMQQFGNYKFATAALSMAVGTATGVGWSSGNHTSDWTLVSAFGPGAELFHGMVRNYEIFGKLLSVRGIEFKNPSMTLEEAQRAEGGGFELESDLHWI